MSGGAAGAGLQPVTTTDLWKLAGLAFVLVDHVGLFFLPEDPWWRVLGRVAAPIFFFLVGFARPRAVPWTWIVLGAVLTTLDTWTSEEGWEGFTLNILLNFALLRLALPVVERFVMPQPWRVALLTLAIALAIPYATIFEYGAEGWLWALLGLAHRQALDQVWPGSRVVRDVLVALVPAIYLRQEIIDYAFGPAEAVVLALLLSALALLFLRFRRAPLSWSPPGWVAALMRFCGRRSLEIYAVTLFAMQLSAYAWGDADADEEDEERDEAS